jgi:hypothetical protein
VYTYIPRLFRVAAGCCWLLAAARCEQRLLRRLVESLKEFLKNFEKKFQRARARRGGKKKI